MLTILIALLSRLAALELPYEVLDSIMELSDLDQDFTDLTRVNVSDDQGPTRPIYRLDLDPDYVAYYEIDIGSDYVVLSSGHKTGDFREVESGPDPRPTDVLIQQAQKDDQRCEKFYRLSPMGLTVCKNDNGTVVAASYNWTSNTDWIDDWRQLDDMVKESLNGLKRQWRERAAHRRTKTDWATTEVVPKGKEKMKEDIDEEALSPGSIVKLALGERFRSAQVYITNFGNSRMRPSSRSEWQRKLCNVLVDVCKPDGSTKVNPSAIKETPNYLLYLKLEVRGNRTFVGNVLQWHEIGFVVEISGPKNEVIKKHFAISLSSKRFRRTTGLNHIRFKNDFPDYEQHLCCGCKSGCSPVAWAQVFGYYDRYARNFPDFFSPTLYGDSSIVAPLYLTSGVKRFVEDIRSQVETFCFNGEGATYNSKMKLIAAWFRARQGSTSRVVTFLENRKRRSSSGLASVQRGGRSWIESKGAHYIKYGYPVIFSIVMEGGSGHTVVATEFKEKTRRYRECHTRKTGWWWGERTKEDCSWKRAYDYEYYVHYGWGGRGNKWQEINPRGAYVAYIKK
ncbi:hypothetical protein ACROYT_G000688 [Oculina patagonica]